MGRDDKGMTDRPKSTNLAGIYRDIAEQIGVEDTYKLYEHFKGQQLSLTMRFYSVEYMEATVRAEYNGTNLKELARKYDYSERRIESLFIILRRSK